jgi:hypothetical protein
MRILRVGSKIRNVKPIVMSGKFNPSTTVAIEPKDNTRRSSFSNIFNR